MDSRPNSALLPIILCTLAVFYVAWGTVHDLSRSGNGTIEWIFLCVSAAVFCVLYRTAFRNLNARDRIIWLGGTALLMVVFCAMAVSSLFQPKYGRDPMPALTFLMASLPTAGLLIRRLIQDRRLRS